ncbi:NAD(P)/FAD-dependent oxidoreductase [Glaciimonas immobilis]|uniref:Flavin-dependent dehydrogenase n=1 Tax=Glaciimonas immobilis TaxID=728004 RepID=A0A840RNJ7_9BURK|nr:NAD(P)/FAD-dependent oxidoreductase [Glaciimonas immobilis]KAF3998841.1 NAD(P)/FAD-dependent oxidoreductase [Glaciimonas immobilis]MBB5198230.1 flavin-dependent dehydrogenase [Glaciimonas immobilis]
MDRNIEKYDVVVIGAGPAGSVAAALLRQQGRRVLVLEREQFPRFSIGESLLPQSMAYLEQAGMLQAVVEAGFQYKNGAAFVRGERSTAFDFRDKFSTGWGTTYQVQRAQFDHVLAKEAERQGAEIRFQHCVTGVDLDAATPLVTAHGPDGVAYQVEAEFILDASGFGRILPRLLALETPSDFPVRGAIFTHIEDGISAPDFDRNKIRVTVHPDHCDVWYWLIPFSGGRCSIGVVAETAFLEQYKGTDTERLQALVNEDPASRKLLQNARWDTPARAITGYSANVKSLWGRGYALLGNAGEFLDPVFSSGVTIALKSASLAAAVLQRHFAGAEVDWENDYAVPLKKGVDTFRTFVESWYAGGFQNVIFHEDQQPEIRRMIAAILAGYAWDEANPYVRESKRRLTVLEEICSRME